MPRWCPQPRSEDRFGLFRLRSPLLTESRFLSFPAGTEMVHFPAFALAHLCIQWVVVRVYRTGFPHSEIPGSKPACGSPRLIAACHVLHRLLLPRHPPCALSNLTIKFTPRMPVPLSGNRTPEVISGAVQIYAHPFLLEIHLFGPSFSGKRHSIK